MLIVQTSQTGGGERERKRKLIRGRGKGGEVNGVDTSNGVEEREGVNGPNSNGVDTPNRGRGREGKQTAMVWTHQTGVEEREGS